MKRAWVGFFVLTATAPGCGRPSRTPDSHAPSAEDLARFYVKTPQDLRAQSDNNSSSDSGERFDFSGGQEDRSWAQAETKLPNESEYSGRVIPQIIEGVVRDRAAGFRACKDEVPGVALFKIYISANGQRVVSRKVKSTLSAKATACLEREWDKVTMPAPDGGPAIAMVPIRFDK